MPNKTIYVSDEDLPLFNRAQELAGGKLSAAISMALRRYVEMEEGRQEGYDEIVVKVGQGAAVRKQRFQGCCSASGDARWAAGSRCSGCTAPAKASTSCMWTARPTGRTA
nr:hypothetical protein GCM10020093_080400 [Planobispora longispora]